MAKVLNKYGYAVVLQSKDGETCQIPVGESKVQDKFCVNVPPKVKILSLDKPVAKETAPAAKPAPESKPKSTTTTKNDGGND